MVPFIKLAVHYKKHRPANGEGKKLSTNIAYEQTLFNSIMVILLGWPYSPIAINPRCPLQSDLNGLTSQNDYCTKYLISDSKEVSHKYAFQNDGNFQK